MFQPLSGLLQTSIRFFFHPLPSREFRLCYLRPTKSNRPLLDSVGLTLLYRLVFYPLLGAIYSAMEVMFIRFIDGQAINPIHLPFGQSLSARFSSFSYNAVYLIVHSRSPLKDSPLPLTALGLAASVTFVVCIPPRSLLT